MSRGPMTMSPLKVMSYGTMTMSPLMVMGRGAMTMSPLMVMDRARAECFVQGLRPRGVLRTRWSVKGRGRPSA